MYNITKINFNTVEKSATKGVFEITPLVKGFGYSVGSALRRTLFSATRGAAITKVAIDGVSHEFSTLEGVHEDVLQILLNLKRVVVQIDGDEVEEAVLTIDATGPGDVTAADIQEDAGVKVINKDLVLTSLNAKKDTFKAQLTVKPGYGYKPVDESESIPIGSILLDANFSPIVNVMIAVDTARVGRDDNFDKLTLTVITDGSADPEESVRSASKVLKEFFYKVESGEEYDTEQDALMAEKTDDVEGEKTTQSGIALDEISLEELRLPTRTVNALRKAGIKTLGDLADRSEDDLLRVRNLGEKSIREIIALLEKEGLK